MPIHNFQRPTISQFHRMGTSVSRWCSGCECPLPEPPPCGAQQGFEPSFLLVTQEAEFSVSGETPIPFSGRALVSGSCFLCEEEYDAYFEQLQEEEEERTQRRSWRRRRRRGCRPSSCGTNCPELELCCLPIIDTETVTPPLCMCGCCDNEPDRSECYNFDTGNIFLAPGVYLIEYSVLVSGTAPYTTAVHLVANGEVIPGSQRDIIYDDTTHTVVVRTMFDTSEPTQISLVSPYGLSLTPSVEGELLVTLSINGMC